MQHRTITTSRPIALPHWQTEEGTYFVTFRLLDSLPQDLARLRGGKRFEEALDRGFGSAHLARKDIGDLVFNALRYFDRERYVLHSAVVMANHVHAVFRTAPKVRLGHVLHTWKGFTARRANQLLGRDGAFWQRESFDRLIRDEREFERANAYVLGNPEKAGLRDWKWVGAFDRSFVVKYEEG
jgi:REP element-mobilizing transposase RayT